MAAPLDAEETEELVRSLIENHAHSNIDDLGVLGRLGIDSSARRVVDVA